MTHENKIQIPDGLYPNPVEAFRQLPEHTRAFLEGLDKEDIQALNDLLKSYQRAATIGWFFKWLVVSMVGAFMAAVSFGESFKSVYNWWKGV